MVVHYPTITIPLLGLVIALWLILCHYTRKRKKLGGQENSSSIFIIPMRGDEESGDTCDPESQPADGHPHFLSFGSVSLPPYTFEPPSYSESPPSYAAEPLAASEQTTSASASYSCAPDTT